VTRHYNQPTNEWLDIFQRFRWETIRMFGLTLVGNHYEAIHALSITRYHALYVPTFEELQRALRIAEISYIIEACAFEGNGGGVLAEHNHVEFSNNVWIWQLDGDRFERNVGGGFVIELPKVRIGDMGVARRTLRGGLHGDFSRGRACAVVHRHTNKKETSSITKFRLYFSGENRYTAKNRQNARTFFILNS